MQEISVAHKMVSFLFGRRRKKTSVFALVLWQDIKYSDYDQSSASLNWCWGI